MAHSPPSVPSNLLAPITSWIDAISRMNPDLGKQLSNALDFILRHPDIILFLTQNGFNIYKNPVETLYLVAHYISVEKNRYVIHLDPIIRDAGVKGTPLEDTIPSKLVSMILFKKYGVDILSEMILETGLAKTKEKAREIAEKTLTTGLPWKFVIPKTADELRRRIEEHVRQAFGKSFIGMEIRDGKVRVKVKPGPGTITVGTVTIEYEPEEASPSHIAYILRETYKEKYVTPLEAAVEKVISSGDRRLVIGEKGPLISIRLEKRVGDEWRLVKKLEFNTREWRGVDDKTKSIILLSRMAASQFPKEAVMLFTGYLVKEGRLDKSKLPDTAELIDLVYRSGVFLVPADPKEAEGLVTVPADSYYAYLDMIEERQDIALYIVLKHRNKVVKTTDSGILLGKSVFQDPLVSRRLKPAYMVSGKIYDVHRKMLRLIRLVDSVALDNTGIRYVVRNGKYYRVIQ